MRRVCLHCALARAVRAELPALEARSLRVTASHCPPVWLPIAGARVYRRLRRLLAEAGALTERGAIKLAVLDLVGKSHVEVTAAVAVGRGTRVLRLAFPRHAAGTLGGGFAEGIGTG